MGSKNSSATARKLQRQAQAIELRRAGKSYAEIASAIGIGKTQAFRLVSAGLQECRDRIDEDAAVLKAEELSRLDAMQSGLWPAARKGDTKAVRAMLALMERRSKLLGLDAPVENTHAHEFPSGVFTFSGANKTANASGAGEGAASATLSL